MKAYTEVMLDGDAAPPPGLACMKGICKGNTIRDVMLILVQH